jgi:23S rRNA (adenine2503-C2)-methyltransferase
MMTEKPLIYDLPRQEITNTLRSWGEPKYRIQQLWKGIYQSLWSRPEDFTILPKTLRERLFDHFSFEHLTPVTTYNSTDGETKKILFHLPDDVPVETVSMEYRKRRTLCISTQSGCAMGCKFCATGQMGYLRNLRTGEIIEQVLYYARQLKTRGERVKNVVFMGMGEPFHNYENVLASIDRLNDPEGMNLGARRFTISTVGLVPAIQRFAKEKRQVNLAVSLHAADDELRSSLMPVNKKYPIGELMAAIQEYIEMTSRRVTFEWALIRGVNDTLEQARKLSALLKGTMAHVNLIPLNPTNEFSGKAPTKKQGQEFQAVLENKGISSTIRLRRGIDIQAGCGQLANSKSSKKIER